MTEPNQPPPPPPAPPYSPGYSAPGQPLNYQGAPPPGYPPYGYVKPSQNFGMQAAKASWVAPIVAVALNVISNSAMQGRTEKAIIGFASLAIYLIGLVSGIIALSLVRKYGRRGILIPAIVGVCINGSLVVLFGVVIVGLTLMR